jgi:pimeloyl-ACP methyl ester carboxylesterase/rhodanese-related sulfurtransferase
MIALCRLFPGCSGHYSPRYFPLQIVRSCFRVCGKRLLLIHVLVPAFVLAGCAAGIGRDDLFARLRDSSAPLVVDVRTRAEYDSDRIPGAVRVPFYSLGTKIEEMGIPKTESIVLYCEHGPRASIGAFFLRLAGYENIYSLEGHMKGWRMSALPLEMTEPAAGRKRKTSAQDPFKTADGSLELVQEPVFGGQVAVYEAGMAHERSVLLIHGVGDDGMKDWKDVIPLLAERYHVVAFDLPGFGRSSKQNILYTPQRYADFACWVAGQYVKGPFAVVGHSLGGAVALRFAASQPEGLDLLVIADAAGILHRVSLVKDMLRIEEEKGKNHVRAARLNDYTRALFDTMEHKGVTRSIEEVLADPALRLAVLGGSPSRIASLALIADDFSAVLDRINVPTLIIWGERDSVAPLRTARILEAHLPSARLELVKNAGHSPMMEQPGQFNAILLAALEQKGVDTQHHAATERGSSRAGFCNKQEGMRFSGDFDNLTLRGCRNVEIRDATIGKLEASESTAVIENAKIAGSGTALRAFRSELILTNVIIESDVAVEVSRSRLDIAGARLEGRKASVVVEKESTLIFSVSRVESPLKKGYMNGSFKSENASY